MAPTDAMKTNPKEDDVMLGVDEIQAGMGVMYKDRKGIIGAVGDDLLPGSDERHVRIDLEGPSSKSNMRKLHEGVIRRYLKSNTTLFIDWTGTLIENGLDKHYTELQDA